MRILFKLIDIIISILYFVFVTVGSLLVFPCRLLSIILFVGVVIILIDAGLSNWQNVVSYCVIGILLNFLPSFFSISFARFILGIKNMLYKYIK